MDRRLFLRRILGGTAAAVATAAAVRMEFVPEIKAAALDELERLEDKPRDELMDSIRESLTNVEVDPEGGMIMVRAPQKVFHPDARIWKSVAGEAEAWADHLHRTTGVDKATLKTACTRLARACDDDLKASEVEAGTQIVVDLPHVTRTWKDARGKPQVEIAMGVEKTEILGHDRWRVGFIGKKPDAPAKLVNASGVEFEAIERKQREIDRLQNEIKQLEARKNWSIERDID